MVEGPIRKRQAFREPTYERDVAVVRGRGPEHVRALIQSDHPAAIPRDELASDEARPGRDIEDRLAGLGLDRRDERATPARVLAEAEDRSSALVGGTDAAEDARRVR